MSALLELPFLLAALASAAATLGLAALARRVGWADGPMGGGGGGEDAARKWQPRPVPPTGGAALVVGLVVLAAAGSGWIDALSLGAGGLTSLALAFLVGLADDLLRGGLAPGRKLLLQAAAAVPWALEAAGGGGALAAAEPGGPGTVGLALLALLAAVAAMNACNTFDNADGALGTLGLVGFAALVPPLAAPLVGFLPFNLDVRAGGGRRVSPTAYLGDAGSHLLGLLLLLTPGAWPLLFLPAIDLARLALVRWRAGGRPWRGDRRHLAHRLAAAGLGRLAVAATLATLAVPALAAHARLGPSLSWLGFLATALLFLLVLARTPDPAAPSPPRGAAAGCGPLELETR